MEFYKLVCRQQQYQLEQEQGQEGAVLDNGQLALFGQAMARCYLQQEQLPLQFRRYLTAYYADGQMAYVQLTESASLAQGPLLDGFATTWLEGQEENRVWLGADGVVENRGPSGEKVQAVWQRILDWMNREQPLQADSDQVNKTTTGERI